jgi:hypothetical protein
VKIFARILLAFIAIIGAMVAVSAPALLTFGVLLVIVAVVALVIVR